MNIVILRKMLFSEKITGGAYSEEACVAEVFYSLSKSVYVVRTQQKQKIESILL
jgi:hypothetical protein